MIDAYKLIIGMNINKEDFLKIYLLTTRGYQFKIYKEYPSKLPRVTTFSKRIVQDWNALPPEIVKSKLILTFKKKMDEYWGDVMYNIPF